MAPFLGRIIAQVVVPVIAVLARALPAAYSAAVQNAKTHGAQAAKDPFTKARMSRSEAFQIMNITEQEATPEVILKQYEKYFSANAVENGGSFYLQSKVYRAKEQLDEFIKEKQMEETKGQ